MNLVKKMNKRIRIESVGTSLPKKSSGSIEHSVIAGKNCLTSSNYYPSEINLLINSGMYKDKHIGEPAMATFIQKKLNLNPEFGGKKTFSFDLLNGGCGMLNAMQIISTLIQSGSIRIGMVVSSEVNPDQDPDLNYKYPRSGAAVLLDISPDSKNGFGSFVFQSFDENADLYNSVVDTKVKRGKLKIFEKDGLEKAYLDNAPSVFNNLLEKEKLTKDDIDLIIPSQISTPFLAELSKKLDIPSEKILNIFDKFGGYTFTTSIMLGYNHALNNNIISSNQKVVFLVFGSGINIGATIYYL